MSKWTVILKSGTKIEIPDADRMFTTESLIHFDKAVYLDGGGMSFRGVCSIGQSEIAYAYRDGDRVSVRKPSGP